MAVKLKRDEHGLWWQAVERWEPVEEPTRSEINKCRMFRHGQRHRKEGRGHEYPDGSYLDGWHAPDQKVPPYVTEAQCVAYRL